MFVCMFYLSPRSRIIVSVWETSELKKKNKENKRRKKRERRRSKCWVSSLQTLRKFCYFFCFIFYEQLRNEPFKRAPFAFSLLFPFLFLSFLVFGTNNRVSHLRDWQRQRLALLSFLLFFNRKETRGAPGRFVFSRSRALSVSVFRVVNSFALVSFELQRAHAKVIRLLCLRTSEKNVFLLRTFVPV